MLFIIPVIALIYFGLWHPNKILFFAFGGLLGFLLVFTMPHRNGVSLALDYLIRRKSGDLVEEEPPDGKTK